jgi:hypothetical protein
MLLDQRRSSTSGKHRPPRTLDELDVQVRMALRARGEHVPAVADDAGTQPDDAAQMEHVAPRSAAVVQPSDSMAEETKQRKGEPKRQPTRRAQGDAWKCSGPEFRLHEVRPLVEHMRALESLLDMRGA